MAGNRDHRPSAEALEQGYEPESLRFRGVVIFVICFVLTGVIIHVIIWFLLIGLRERERLADVPTSALTSLPQPSNGAPPLQPSGPEHDTLPFEDLVKMHQQESAVFEHLGWKVDPSSLAAGIPDDLVSAVEAREAAERSKSAPASNNASSSATTQPAALSLAGKGTQP